MKLGVYATAILIGVVLALLPGCNTGAKVEDGLARDTIFSVERSRADTYGIFLTHDESVAYCTPDRDLGKRARSLLQEHDGEVMLYFKSKEVLTDTEGDLLGADQCQKYCVYNGESTDCFVTVILTGIDPVPGRN